MSESLQQSPLPPLSSAAVPTPATDGTSAANAEALENEQEAAAGADGAAANTDGGEVSSTLDVSATFPDPSVGEKPMRQQMQAGTRGDLGGDTALERGTTPDENVSWTTVSFASCATRAHETTLYRIIIHAHRRTHLPRYVPSGRSGIATCAGPCKRWVPQTSRAGGESHPR